MFGLKLTAPVLTIPAVVVVAPTYNFLPIPTPPDITTPPLVVLLLCVASVKRVSAFELSVVKLPAPLVTVPIATLFIVPAAVGAMVSPPTGSISTAPVPVGEIVTLEFEPFIVTVPLAARLVNAPELRVKFPTGACILPAYTSRANPAPPPTISAPVVVLVLLVLFVIFVIPLASSVVNLALLGVVVPISVSSIVPPVIVILSDEKSPTMFAISVALSPPTTSLLIVASVNILNTLSDSSKPKKPSLFC